MGRYIFTFSLIMIAVMVRLLPHPPNVTPITAIALFSGVYLARRLAFVVPLAIMLVSDYFIGFHDVMLWVYASFLLIGVVGIWLRKHQGVTATLGATLAGSILFFLITNFGVWLSAQSMYTHNLTGLYECYIAAIPFFRNTLIGDVFYVGALFGLYELAKRYLPTIFVAKSNIRF